MQRRYRMWAITIYWSAVGVTAAVVFTINAGGGSAITVPWNICSQQAVSGPMPSFPRLWRSRRVQIGTLEARQRSQRPRTGIALPAHISTSAWVSGCLVTPLFSLCEAAEPQVSLGRPGVTPTWSLTDAQTLEKDSRAGLENTFWEKVPTCLPSGRKEKSNWRGTGERCPGGWEGQTSYPAHSKFTLWVFQLKYFFA